MKKDTYANISQNKIYITVLILEEVGFTVNITIRDKEENFKMIKDPIY